MSYDTGRESLEACYQLGRTVKYWQPQDAARRMLLGQAAAAGREGSNSERGFHEKLVGNRPVGWGLGR